MLMYSGKVTFYEEAEGKEVTEFFFAAADNYAEVMDKVSHYYSEDVIDSVSLSVLSPEAMIVFGEGEEDLFKRAQIVASENASW